MRKKLVCLVLFVALLATVAFAEGVGSRSMSSLTSVTPASVSENGTVLPSNFAIREALVPSVTQLTKFAELAAYSASGAAPVNYFGADVHNEVETLLVSAGVNADSLKLSECAPMTIDNYDPSFGDVKVTVGFPTVYKDGQTVIAVIGYQDGDTFVWVPVEATVVNGELEFVIPESVLSVTTEIMVAILND